MLGAGLTHTHAIASIGKVSIVPWPVEYSRLIFACVCVCLSANAIGIINHLINWAYQAEHFRVYLSNKYFTFNISYIKSKVNFIKVAFPGNFVLALACHPFLIVIYYYLCPHTHTDTYSILCSNLDILLDMSFAFAFLLLLILLLLLLPCHSSYYIFLEIFSD